MSGSRTLRLADCLIHNEITVDVSAVLKRLLCTIPNNAFGEKQKHIQDF